MEYIYTILVLIGIWIILSSSFNLIIGYGGLISIAHPIFYALGGYTSALLSLELGIPVVVSTRSLEASEKPLHGPKTTERHC